MANRQLFLKAATTSQLVGRIVEAQLEPVGIPGFLLALLTHVRDLAPVSPTAVSLASGRRRRRCATTSSASSTASSSERVPNPDDGRSYLLVLTPRGEGGHAGGRPCAARGLCRARGAAAAAAARLRAVLDELNEALQGPATWTTG